MIERIELLSVGSLGLLLALVAAHRVQAGIAFILVTFVVHELLGWTPIGEFGVTSVYLPDGVFILLTISTAVRILRQPRWSIFQALWTAFGVVVVFSWLRGVSIFGLNSATNDLRQFFYLWAGTAYVSSFDLGHGSLYRIYHYWSIASLALLVLILSRYFFPIPTVDLSYSAMREGWGKEIFDVGFESGRDWLQLRVVGAQPARFLSQTALLAMIVWFRGRKPDALTWFLPVWLGLVLVLQHRTVWTTFLICTMLLIPTLRFRGSTFIVLAGGFALVALAGLIRVATDAGDTVLATSLGGAVKEIGDVSDSTWWFRIRLWENYLDTFLRGSLVEYLFGQPLGTVVRSSIAVGLQVVLTEAFPHNFYLYVGFYLGIAGLGLIVVSYALLIPRLWRLSSTQTEVITGRDWAVLLAGQLAYSFSYGVDWEQSIVLGTAMSLAAARMKKFRDRIPAPGKIPTPSIYQVGGSSPSFRGGPGRGAAFYGRSLSSDPAAPREARLTGLRGDEQHPSGG